ncbi:MAG: hypothetical protein WD011_03760 [Nitriliruptoraceae bacterium]
MRSWSQWFATLLAMATVTGILGSFAADAGSGVERPTDGRSDDVGDTPSAPAAPDQVVDWHGGATLELPNGWQVAGCDGDAPLLCVTDADRHVGTVEIDRWPVDARESAPAALRTHVDEFLAGMRADRALGCPDATFTATEVRDITFASRPGLRAGFRLERDGVEIERHVLFWMDDTDGRWVVTAGAYADDACMERLGEFTPQDLAAFEPHLEAIVAQSPLPALDEPGPSPAGEPETSGRFVALDSATGVLTLDRVEVLSGDEARDAARIDGEIGLEDDLPNDVYVRDLGERVELDIRGAAITLVDCRAGCEEVDVPVAALLDGSVQPFNGSAAVFAFEVVDGTVVALREIYLP